MNKLLARIEALETLTQRLEQEIKDIRNSCFCLAPLPDEPIPSCGPPTCEDCGEYNCVCDERDIDEEPKEPNEEVNYE